MSGFWTFKTSGQLLDERVKARNLENSKAKTSGLDSIVGKRRAEIDAYEERVSGFLADVTAVFEAQTADRFLGEEYPVQTKFEGIDAGERHLRMKWNYWDDNLKYNAGFAVTEEAESKIVRVDFMAETQTVNEDRKRISRLEPHFDFEKDKGHHTRPKFDVIPVEDKFQSTRFFRDYAEYSRSLGSVMPIWFAEYLKRNIGVRTGKQGYP